MEDFDYKKEIEQINIDVHHSSANRNVSRSRRTESKNVEWSGGPQRKSFTRRNRQHSYSIAYHNERESYNKEGEMRDYSQRNFNGRKSYYKKDSYVDYQQESNFGEENQLKMTGYNSHGGFNVQNRSNRKTFKRSDDPSRIYSQKKILRYKELNVDPSQPMRLNKYIANAGVCSRRDADSYIKAGLVTVNGTIVTELGSKVYRTDEVLVRGEKISLEAKVYILLNKPKNCLTTSEDPKERKTVLDLVKGACSERIYPVGRLDRNTTGVLLLTNDGELASKLMHPSSEKKKIYHVFCDKKVTNDDMQKMLDGIVLEDGEIKVDRVEHVDEGDKSQVGVEIHSGRNRIVRRIFDFLGYKVEKLDRVYFAGLTKKNLRRGQWRFLTEEEVIYLRMGSYE